MHLQIIPNGIFQASMSVVFQNSKQNLVYVTECNDQLKTNPALTYGNLQNLQGWRVEGEGEGPVVQLSSIQCPH